MNAIPLIKLPLSYSTTLWVADRINCELLTLGTSMDPYHTLEQKVADQFKRQFPDFEWDPDYFHTTWSKRVAILKEFKRFPDLLSVNGTIQFGPLIRNVLAVNPILSDGAAPCTINDWAKITKIEDNRQQFCRKICELSAKVEGIELNFEEVNREIASIQQMLLRKDLITNPNDCLEQLFDFFYLCRPIGSETLEERQRILFQNCVEFQQAAQNTSAHSLLIQIGAAAARLRQPNPSSLWPGLQGSEGFIRNLALKAVPFESTFLGLVKYIESTLNLGRELPMELSCEELFESAPESKEGQFVESLAQLYINPEEIFELYRQLPTALLRGSITTEIRHLLSFDPSFANEFFKVPSPIEHLIQFQIEKNLVDAPHADCEALAKSVFSTVSPFLEMIRTHPLFSPENQSDLIDRTCHYDLKGDLAFRLMLPDDSSGFKGHSPLLRKDSPLFQILRATFKTSLQPHPLLNISAIFHNTLTAYFSHFPSMKNEQPLVEKCLSVYLKCLWYAPQLIKDSPFHAMPATKLYLQWEAAKIADTYPEISLRELRETLSTLSIERLPNFPIHESEIEYATYFLQNHLLRRPAGSEIQF